VIDGFKDLYQQSPEIQKILNQISKTTNFNYRLTNLVAGARTKSDFYECMDQKRPKWCENQYLIVPGGRVFSDPVALELILAHEVGHMINKVDLPTLEFNDKVDQIRACNHLGSKLINKIEIESEASADIYMSRYFKRFMNSDKAQTHFCHYKAPTNYQEANYLHPYHRQALISCF